MPTASSQSRNTAVCLASSKQNWVRYISSPNRPSAAIACRNGCRSSVTASSPATNCEHSINALCLSLSLSSCQSFASWLKSMSRGFQNLRLPLSNSRKGSASQFSPPERSELKPCLCCVSLLPGGFVVVMPASCNWTEKG